MRLEKIVLLSAVWTAFSAFAGFYRTEQADGGWRVLDPAGKPITVLAIEKANMRGPFCEKLGNHPYEESMKRRGETREAWVARTAERLRTWGFNVLGTSCDDWLKRKGFGYTEMFAFGGRMAKKGGEYCISPWKGAPCQAFPNVFHSEFKRLCDEVAKEGCARHRDDPALLGYYLDNELNWWGDGDWYRPGMLDHVLRTLSEDHLAYRVAVKTLERTVKVGARAYLALPEAEKTEARALFTRIVAREYFKITTEAIRRYDPNHLILGCRFAGVQGGSDEAWSAAGRYCDVVSFNCYPHADFEGDRLTVRVHHRTVGKDDARFVETDLGEVMDRLSRVTGKPMFVTEWSFIGLDAGLPCKVGCGQRLATQADRARAVGLFLDFILTKPYMIGSEYFMWVDEPALGCTAAHPEDSNYGLVDVEDRPYREVTEAFRARNPEGGEWIRPVRTPEGWRFRSPDGTTWKARGIEKVRAESGEPLSRQDWAKLTAQRLSDWGFNMIGSGSDWMVSEKGRLVTTEMIALSMWMKDRGDAYRLTLKSEGFCDELANVFHPEFSAVCDEAAKASCSKHCADMALVGYYLDNELDWWGDGDWRACGLMDYALKTLPTNHTARIAAERFRADYPDDPAKARLKFTEEVAERYFSTIVRAIRRYDPNHLVLGVRFAGIYGAPDPVWRIAGKWCDVVTLNCYPRVDLEKDEVWLPVQRADDSSRFERRTLAEMLEERHRISGRPLLITEWSFLGLDVGTPHRLEVAQEFSTQSLRAAAVASFRRLVGRLPFVIGDEFYRWSDEAVSANGRTETMNWGLVDLHGRPHEEVVKEMRRP